MWAGGLWVLWRLHYPSKIIAADGTEQRISPWRRASTWMRAYIYIIMVIWFPALIVFTIVFARMKIS